VKSRRIAARGVLLDWDGTLLDSFEADARAYAAMFRALGIAWTERDLARHYSPNWHRIYEAARIPRKLWEEADQLWARAYQRENPKLLPGAREALKTLKRNFSLGLVTSGDRERVRRQLRRFRLETTFAACVCSEDAPHRKPHPAPLQVAMAQMNADAYDCVYVGDSPEDVEMARRARVRVIGVIGPFPTALRVRAARPDMLIDSIQELPEALETLILKSFN
jgi:HAD superfamily hydrolase (TIGR01549 family)